MTGAEQAAWTVGSMVGGALLLQAAKAVVAWARKGQQAEEHKNFVTTAACEKCQADHLNDMTAGNESFRLLLEGQSLHTQALVHLCEGDDGCRELRAKLQDYLVRLASRQIGR